MTETFDVQTAAVLGCGTIGASWAALFSARGVEVRAWDPADGARAQLEAMVETAMPVLAELHAPVGRQGEIHFFDTPREAVDGADLVQESAPERLGVKRALYAEIAPVLASHAILASSTSSLRPSQLQEGCAFAERLLVGHPFNPPHLIPLVEVVGGALTTPETVERAMAFYAGIGKRPIRLNHEVAGHLVNRLQAAIWREAIHAVATGLASVEDVDAAVAYGPGLRWALMGPHLTFHLGGGEGGMRHFIDQLGDANEAIWKDLGRPHLTEEVSRALMEGCVAQAKGQSIEELRARRDKELIAVLRHVNRVV